MENSIRYKSPPQSNVRSEPMSANGKEKRATERHHNQTESVLSEAERLAQYALAQECLHHDWTNNGRWKGVERAYSAEDVLRLRGSVHIEHTLAPKGRRRPWQLLQTDPYVNALGPMTGNQAVQQV